MSFESLINRDEIRRLEKAARDKDKKKLADWAKQYEATLRSQYEKEYQSELAKAINNFCIAIAYTVHFCEHTRLGKQRLPEFMEDLFVTVDMFRTGEYNPLDYIKELESCGIIFDDYQYRHIEDEERKKKVIESWELRPRVKKGDINEQTRQD